MMNEWEKSDPCIVAKKPANNVEGTTAESVEPRRGTEGNTSEFHMRRTLSRGSVTMRLVRVRERAQCPLLRHQPKVGAQYANRVRWDLRGGCSEMGIPTAIPSGYCKA